MKMGPRILKRKQKPKPNSWKSNEIESQFGFTYQALKSLFGFNDQNETDLRRLSKNQKLQIQRMSMDRTYLQNMNPNLRHVLIQQLCIAIAEFTSERGKGEFNEIFKMVSNRFTEALGKDRLPRK